MSIPLVGVLKVAHYADAVGCVREEQLPHHNLIALSGENRHFDLQVWCSSPVGDCRHAILTEQAILSSVLALMQRKPPQCNPVNAPQASL